MPNQMLKGAVKYCIEDKRFFLFVLIQFFIFECIANNVGGIMKSTSIIVLLIILGYGLKVTQDVIYGGKHLPKIKIREWVDLGFKGFIVYSFYLTIQASALFLLSKYLNFPPFDLEEMILYLGETVELFFEHDPISFIIFILAGLIIVYVTIFFMEISLAKLADGEHLKDAFDFREIKHVIETIGWNNYAIDYTKIVLALVILISINIFFTRYNGLNIIMGVITDILAFLVEYRGIGNIYREYKELTA